jgi:hypothetical protein
MSSNHPSSQDSYIIQVYTSGLLQRFTKLLLWSSIREMGKNKVKRPDTEVIGEWSIGSNEIGVPEVQPMEALTSEGLRRTAQSVEQYYRSDVAVGAPDRQAGEAIRSMQEDAENRVLSIGGITISLGRHLGRKKLPEGRGPEGE